MCKPISSALSNGTKNLYKKTFTRLANGYADTKGISGPVTPGAMMIGQQGIVKISAWDKFLHIFAGCNKQIASVSRRTYGTDIATRKTLGNAGARHRTLVDMSRNNNGGLFRVVFDKFGQITKSLSIGKDGSSVSTSYKKGYIDGLGRTNLSKKVVRNADGEKIREVYAVRPIKTPETSYTLVVDKEKGLKRIITSEQGVNIFKQGDAIDTFSKNPQGELVKDSGHAAGVDTNLQLSLEILKQVGWENFLKNQSMIKAASNF